MDTVLDDCLPCEENCSECVSLAYCLSCNAGFYLTSAHVCEPCEVFECATCNSTTQNCLSCHLGYFLDTSTTPDSCVDCLSSIPHCEVCTTSALC